MSPTMVVDFCGRNIRCSTRVCNKLKANPLFSPTILTPSKSRAVADINWDYSVKWKCCDRHGCIVIKTEVNLHQHVKTILTFSIRLPVVCGLGNSIQGWEKEANLCPFSWLCMWALVVPSMRTPHHLPANFPSHPHLHLLLILLKDHLLLCPLADKTVLLLFIYFWCEPFLKIFIGFFFLQYCFCFIFWFFWPQGMWDLTSPSGDRTHTRSIARWPLNHWTTSEVPETILLEHITSVFSPPDNHRGLLTVLIVASRHFIVCRLFLSPCLTCFLASGHIDLAPFGICQAHSPPKAFALVSSAACSSSG